MTALPADPLTDDTAPGAELRAFAPDSRWWPALAGLVCELGAAGLAAGARDLRRVTVIVPTMILAPPLLGALRAHLQDAGFVAPRVLTLEQWTGTDDAALQRQRVELFQALRANPWIRSGFGAQASALWTLARDLAWLGDELTLAAGSSADAFVGRWRASIGRCFAQRAAAAGEPQAQLVLALWRAGLSADVGAVRLLRALARRARAAAGPLIWLAPRGALAWQRTFCRRYTAAGGYPAILAVPDYAALDARHPWLAAAWPELVNASRDAVPLAERARALRPRLRPGEAPPLQILAAQSLEDEALAAAHWVVERLQTGAATVAVVALDRLTARRVRALLERAGVLLADEAGWKLSTTSAAAALMRWIDLAQSDFATADLLDWLRSPFTLGQEEDKAARVERIACTLREAGVIAGAGAVRAALAAGAHDARGAAALRLVDTLIELARQWQRPGTLGRHLGLLAASLDQLGMRAALAADPVGGALLVALEALHGSLIGSDLALDAAEFRALLSATLEERRAADREIASPVAMTTLAGTRLRQFDAVLLIGADAEHLPARAPLQGLLANAVRRDLGLRTDTDHEREQGHDLLALLAGCVQVAATWRSRDGDEPRPLSPLLDRMNLLSELVCGEGLVRAPARARLSVLPVLSAPRSPRAPALLPARLSAAGYQDLVDCPYRFFARRLLGLRENEPIGPRPRKRDFGLLLHEVLFHFHAHAAAAPPLDDDAAALARLHELVDTRFAPLLAQQPALIAYRERLRGLLPGYLTWARADQAQGWRWLAGEMALRQPLSLGSGRQIELHGRIDRIDGATDGRRRLIDYKSGDAAGLRRSQREPGEDVQLLFYALLQDPPAAAAAYLSLQRPKDLRDPAHGVVSLVSAPSPLAEHAAALALALAQDLDRIGAGAGLPANGAEIVCRFCELRSLCRHGYTVPAVPVP